MRDIDGSHLWGTPPDIIQIIPAPDWYAVYRDPDGGEDDMVIPLSCWALIEVTTVDGIDRFVDGIEWTWVGKTNGGPFATEMDGFKYFRYGPARGSGQTNNRRNMTEETSEMVFQKKALTFDESRMYCGGFSRPRFYELKIPSYKVGRKRFFLRAELDQWLAAQAAA